MNKISIILILLLCILWIVSCSEETNPITTGEIPEISEVKLPANWSTHSTRLYKVEARVKDPQGPGNLSGVDLNVYDSSGEILIFSDSLYDDGAYFFPKDGDVLAGDGIFSNQFSAPHTVGSSNQVELVFRFRAFDKQNHESQVWENVIGFSPNSPPKINQIFAPDSISFRDENTIWAISVSDSDGISDISRAYVESEDPVRQIINYELTLHNDGDFENHGDLVAGDSIFSGRMLSSFLVGKKGDYNLIFHVEDLSEEQNIEEAKQNIFIENYMSEFLDFTIPETITIPADSGFVNIGLMQVEVYDPEGIADIDSVYFYSLKPDSNYAQNGLPFLMVDNGLPLNLENPLVETGDAVADDGIYSLSLLVYHGSLPGIYTFTFYIRDWAGNLTGPIEQTIELIL
jgi:hypothetical protein